MHFTPEEIEQELRRLMPPDEMDDAAFALWVAAVVNPDHPQCEAARAQESRVLTRFVDAFHDQVSLAVQKRSALHDGVLIGKINMFPIPLALVQILHPDVAGDGFEYGVWYVSEVMDALRYDRPLVHPEMTRHAT